ncbi:hypothetical protein AA0117_g3493 [Alternaria alternata]|uniref:Uncharacterized protein n=1 Tax=Alternaria alternata TaxID=5599 RepID=A0A4Q4NLT5_ALTAL|nr:hypothetical protein AA0117_g3493 [Alternaria alternata]
MISWAIDGAIQMAIETVKDMTDHEHDPAFWELYGPRAVQNLTSIRSAFEQVAHGPWTIEASCNIDDQDPACSDPFMYGGIGDMITEGQAAKRDESQTFSAKLTFCQDFFTLPPLDHRIQLGVSSDGPYLGTRYDLGYYHDNQGKSFTTTLLRSLFRYLPVTEGLNRPISDLWVLLRQIAGDTTWSACYGIYCAKVLARLNDPSIDWASVNADNYALYALSKYVAPRIRGNFTFLPEMKDYLNVWKAFAVPQGAAHDAPAVVYDLYGKPTSSQTYYNATRLQSSTGTFDPNNILDSNRKADISHTPFLKNIGTYPSTYSSELARWESEFTPAFQDLLINIDATYDRTCFSDTTSSHPEANYFDGYEALDFAKTFCEDIVAHREEGNGLPSTVRAALWTKNFTRQYTLKKTNPGMHLGFAVTGDPASYIESRSADWLFEGPDISANVDHCVLTYKDVISHVSEMK